MLHRADRVRQPRAWSAMLAQPLLACVWTTAALALPPAPLNDTPSTAQLVGNTFPQRIYATSVRADNSINNGGGDPDVSAIATFMDGPDVFYRIEPTVSGTYRFYLAPWQQAPLRSSNRRFTLYLMEDLGAGLYDFLAGARAPGDVRPVNLDLALVSGGKYVLGVDHDAASGVDNFPFTLFIDRLVVTNPDNCASAEALPSALPVIRMNNMGAAANDFTFAQSTGQCATAGTPTTAGPDHVYTFTPGADGYYAIELISDGFNAVLYVDDSCAPFFPDSCQGASDHSATGTSGARHELVNVFLFGSVPYDIYVDSSAAAPGAYTLVIDDAVAYQMTEEEPNDTSATATAVAPPLAGGQLVGPVDTDYWSVTGNTGDRVYAYVETGGALNSTLDTELRMFAANGTTLIEYDDDDSDGISSPYTYLHFVYSTSSAAIAGARLTSNGTHYLKVDDKQTNGTVNRYLLHAGVESAERAPQAEVEPNDTIAQATVSGLNFFHGAVTTSSDVDFFAFDAVAEDRVFIAFDGDPERDSSGGTNAATDPLAFSGMLLVHDPDNDVLLSDVSDDNTVQTGNGDFPAQGAFFIAHKTGRYKVEVRRQSAAGAGPNETYDLAIFLNGEPPQLAELVPPVLTLVSDFDNDIVLGTATDSQPGDLGICDVTLLNAVNLQLAGLSFTDGDPVVEFTVELIDDITNGSAVVLITDCAGNTTSQFVTIDVNAPSCGGFEYAQRVPRSQGDPIMVPDNQPSGPGIDSIINVPEAGAIIDVNVMLTIETTSVTDLDVFLISPAGTSIELFTDRGSSGHNVTDAVFDDSAAEIMSLLGSAEPYAGPWKPEVGTLAALNGQNAQGNWRLNVRDDSSSENGGSRLVRWSLDIIGAFAAGPESFDGVAQDAGAGAGIQSVVLTGAVNTQIDVAPFMPGALVVPYTVSLIDPSQNGSGTVVVTDQSENVCSQPVTLTGLDDVTAPSESGDVTQNLVYTQEVQAELPSPNPAGIISTINVPISRLVGEVETSFTIDTKEVGRLVSTLSHDGEFASLINRPGMAERAGAGLAKNTIDVAFDDDAPASADAHLEPALGSIPFVGLRQPDGRGEFLGDGIDADFRDNMLFRLAGSDSAGTWNLYAADVRLINTTRSTVRRWSLTLKNPCGPERYTGTVKDLDPGSGICNVALQPGSSNVAVSATFTPGTDEVSYAVDLVSPALPGSGTVEITDCAGNPTLVPVTLAAASGDDNLPVITGAVNGATAEYEGTATDIQAGDTGVSSIGLAPYANNLQIVSVTPSGGSADFVVGLVNPAANGRGYVRVTDGCGLRAYVLVEIDALPPVCSGTVGQTKRYFSGVEDIALPDNNLAGVTSSIVVTDSGGVADADITLNITHAFDSDIDLFLTSPSFIGLFSERGSTGNDFVDTTLDDEAAGPLPTGSTGAPFTGSFKPNDGTLATLDGDPIAGTYTLQIVDDKTNDFGVFRNWSLLIESANFVEQYDGRAQDNAQYDFGICSVELLPGADNLVLHIDPAFVPGDGIVRYTVNLADDASDGAGTVRVTDCAGNTCEVPIALVGQCLFADLDGDLDIDAADYLAFRQSYGRTIGDPQFNPLCDFDHSGAVGLLDFQTWLFCYRDFVGNPLAAPPVLGTGGLSVSGIRPGRLQQQALDQNPVPINGE